MRSRIGPWRVLDRPRGRAGRNGWRRGEVTGSAVLVLLLFSEVASLVTGMGALYFAFIVAAWLVLPAVVGFKNILDAGCFFMLVSLGILVVVDLAGQGQVPA
jgi:hypothetical protein